MTLSTVALGGLLALLTGADDWPQFRGPNGSGVADGPAPVEFGPERNLRWRTPLESGHSSPCVVGDAVFLTTFDEKSRQLAVVCLSQATGEVRWSRPVPVEKVEEGHPSFSPASSTCASDGGRVVSYFGSFGLICHDLHGTLLWTHPLPLSRSFSGNATSPIVAGDKVFLYRGNDVDHFLLAVDKRTGEQVWKVPQSEPITGEMACTACPVVSGGDLVVHSARSVQAFDRQTGRRRWVAKCATTATSTPVLAGGRVLVAAWNKLGEPDLRPPLPAFADLVGKHDADGDGRIGRGELPVVWIFHRPEGAEAPMNGATVSFDHADRDKDGSVTADEWATTAAELEGFRAGYETHGLLSLPLDTQGPVAADLVRTLATRNIPEVPSPVTDGRYVYLVKNGGVLTCIDLATGKATSRQRTPGRGTHYASPIIAADRLYLTAGDGRISVMTLGPEPQALTTNDLGVPVYATPAVADGVLYVRTHDALYAFGAEGVEDRR